MKVLFAFVLVATIALIVQAHPTFYKVDRNVTCYSPTPAPIFSWHVHVLYWNKNKQHTAGAYDVRDTFIAAFKDRLDVDCTDLFDQDQLCMFEPDREAIGPFVTAQWSVFLKNEDFADVVPWFIQNRNGYDVLVHPNTGCEVEDHSWWAMWVGTAWQVDLSVMGHDKPFPWVEANEINDLRPIYNTTTDGSELIQAFLAEHEQ